MRHRTSREAARTAIPTRYRKIQFRSRLEACWASFFDQCHLHWEYEPIDFQGWSPDFLIHEGNYLAEVKPISARDEELQRRISDIWIPAEFTPLILGVGPIDRSIGWVRDEGIWCPATDIVEGDVHDLWAWAKNSVQWRPPRKC